MQEESNIRENIVRRYKNSFSKRRNSDLVATQKHFDTTVSILDVERKEIQKKGLWIAGSAGAVFLFSFAYFFEDASATAKGIFLSGLLFLGMLIFQKNSAQIKPKDEKIGEYKTALDVIADELTQRQDRQNFRLFMQAAQKEGSSLCCATFFYTQNPAVSVVEEYLGEKPSFAELSCK